MRVLYPALTEPVIYACPHFFPALFSGQLIDIKNKIGKKKHGGKKCKSRLEDDREVVPEV